MKFLKTSFLLFLLAASGLARARDLAEALTEVLPIDSRACIYYGTVQLIQKAGPQQLAVQERLLAKGGSADVYRVVLPNGDVVVRKYFSTRGVGAKFSLRDYQHEDQLYKHLEKKAYKQMLKYRGLWRDEKGRVYLEFAESKGASMDTHLRSAFIHDNSAKASLQNGLGEFEKALIPVEELHVVGEVVHFDLKGANIYRTSDGHYRILDFASARIKKDRPDAAGQYFDRPSTYSKGYTAPEVIEGKGYGVVSDVYSMGKILELELLPEWEHHARLLGLDAERLAAWRKSFNDAVLNKAIHPDPKQRFQTIAQLRGAIWRWRNFGWWWWKGF